MGDNCAAAGFAAVETFVAAMMESEDRHLAAFCAFVESARTGRCAGAARLGRSLRAAITARPLRKTGTTGGWPKPIFGQAVERCGAASTGPAVRDLQLRLDLASDGRFGPLTEAAVRALQRSAGLLEDGIVGAATRPSAGERLSAGSGTLRPPIGHKAYFPLCADC